MNTFSVIRHVDDDSPGADARFIIRSLVQKPGQGSGHLCATQQMENELQFWKLEMPALLKVLKKLDCRKLALEERTRLSAIQKEFICLLEEMFPVHELAFDSIRQKKVIKGEFLCPFVQDHLKLRQAYWQLKLELFPLLSKMASITIW